VRIFAQHNKRAEHLIVRIMCIFAHSGSGAKTPERRLTEPGRPKIEQR
jgi:hypothetical protein